MSQDTNRYVLAERVRYSIAPFQRARGEIHGTTIKGLPDREIADCADGIVPIGRADFLPTWRDRLTLVFCSRWMISLYASKTEVRELPEFEIHDRHAGLVPGVPEVARTLPDHNRAEANAFCDELNRQYNKNPGVVRRDTPMSTEELQRSVAQMRKR